MFISQFAMELDKRSCHWIATIAAAEQPCEADINTLNANNVIAKWNIDTKSLSVWYTFEYAQRASTIANAYAGDVILKRCKLSNMDEFKALPATWEQISCKLPGQLAAELKADNGNAQRNADNQTGSPVGSKYDDNRSTNGSGSESESAITEFERNAIEFGRIKRRIAADHAELETISKRLKLFIN